MRDTAEIMRNNNPSVTDSHIVRENFASRGTTRCHFTNSQELRTMEEWGQVLTFNGQARLPADADVQPEAPDEFSDILVIDGKDYLVKAVRKSRDRGRSHKTAFLQARGGE